MAKKQKTYWVGVDIIGRATVSVYATSAEEAIEKVEMAHEDAEFELEEWECDFRGIGEEDWEVEE